ncbi:yqaJ domain-containing protein [Nephila pilipes]|uniref:YqaJ domain-containing protein n=1 Tax=Nephila pilipes TaxID=299642 RepID=A0A8X6TNK7_NEPPI|nr:yqaJ domain-containing protein [Nephila pilipes]
MELNWETKETKSNNNISSVRNSEEAWERPTLSRNTAELGLHRSKVCNEFTKSFIATFRKSDTILKLRKQNALSMDNATDDTLSYLVERTEYQKVELMPHKRIICDTEAYDILLKNHLDKISIACNNELEERERAHWTSDKWREVKSLGLSSSSFKDVLCRRVSSSANLVKRLLFRCRLTTKVMGYSLANEEVASETYATKYITEIKYKCVLFVDPDNPYLCTSPDGFIGSDG